MYRDKNMTILGMKHAQIGVKIEHFPVMGEGLFHALEIMLKNDFNDDLRDAWLTAYSRMSSKIISVLRTHER